MAAPCTRRGNERKRDNLSHAYWSRAPQQMKPLFVISLSLALLFSGLAAAASSPAGLISEFCQKHGEGRVVMDATLNRIALEQAKAMAERDRLTTTCSGLSVGGSHLRGRDGPLKTSPMATTVSKRRSISGSRRANIERTCCFPTRLASASPAQEAPPRIGPIGRWRSRAIMNRREWLSASGRRLLRPRRKCRQQPNERQHNLAD